MNAGISSSPENGFSFLPQGVKEGINTTIELYLEVRDSIEGSTTLTMTVEVSISSYIYIRLGID